MPTPYRQQTEEGMETTVIQHVLSRLHDIGIKDIFGVAGDFAFPIDDAVSSNRNLRWVGGCNELNAAYAADGYARTHGVAARSVHHLRRRRTQRDLRHWRGLC